MSGPVADAVASAGAHGGQPDSAFRIDILTLFPEMFTGPFDHSMLARARAAGLVSVQVHPLRRWALGKHQVTDDYAFGGGGGMVMKAEPFFLAVEELLGLAPITRESPARPDRPVVLMSPRGQAFNDDLARELAAGPGLVILCGHYEGVDQRVTDQLATHEISVGDFVVTGGELPAMLVADAVARLRPGVLGLTTATQDESFAQGGLEHPHYTRPRDFRGWTVPEVLLSGDHGAIAQWRRREAIWLTARTRPDRLGAMGLTGAEVRWLADAQAAEAKGLPRP